MVDFFEFSNEMFCLADRRGYFTRVNEAWTRTLGWSSEELTSRPYLEFVHPDDRERTIREAKALESDSHETVRFENRYRCRNEDYRWLSWLVVPDAETGLLVCAVRDVTEDKAQKESLRRAEERFRTLAALAPVGIAEGDSQARITYVNRKWCELAGVTFEEALGYSWKETIHPDDLPAQVERIQRALASKQDIPPHEFRFVHRNGDIRWGLGSIALVKNQFGEIVGQIATVEDVTERKQAEIALREAEERFRAFMDNTPTIAWAKDEQGRIVFLNRAGQERFGLSCEEWIGKTDYDFWPSPIAARLQSNDRRVLETGCATQMFEETESDTQPRSYWITFLFPYADGKGRRYVGGIAVDITELKRAEQVLKAKQDLMRNLIEVQEKEKQHVSYEFHDGMIQYATAALMFLQSHANKHPQSDRSLIELAMKSLRTGIDDGRRVVRGIRPTVLDDSGVQAAIEDLIDQQPPSKMRIEWTCDPDLQRLPQAVEAAVYRVTQEALTNARKYSRSELVQITLGLEGREVRLEVRDFGAGFDVAEARNRGFGLVGMVERVRLLDGECVIESRPNEGSRVLARIPLPPADEIDDV